MKRTRISDLLGIQYPIIQGGMLWLADAGLAAAVSNAGALGIISPFAGMPTDGDVIKNLEEQIRQIRRLTDRPFGVNIPLDLSQSGILINVLLEHDVKIVITAAGSPELYTDLLKQLDKTVMHVVSSVKQGRLSESCGVDAVITEGIEAAAHNGKEEIPLFSLIPQMTDALSVPVVAAGGIVDGRGMAAAETLGAEGVQLGTRFIAVDENPAHENYKQAILEADETGTVITGRNRLPTRNLKTSFSGRLLQLEKSGASSKEIAEFLGYRRSRISQLEGFLDLGETFAGSSVGMIKEILPVAEVIQKLVDGYHQAIKRPTVH